MTTAAVIQPYFFPYAGYFRLFAAAEIVVLFDCVQFPRRGWVHRNRFALSSGELDWLTLPLAKAPYEARIDELRFREDSAAELLRQARRFPVIEQARAARHPLVERMLRLDDSDAATYLCDTLLLTARSLDLERTIVRSSSLNVDPGLRGQDRVIEIAQRVGAKRYVNPSGGRELYDSAGFKKAGLELRFLRPFEGAMESILSRAIAQDAGTIRREIVAQSELVP